MSLLLWGILIVVIGGGVVTFNYALFRRDLLEEAHQMPAIRPSPGFTLIERSGETVTSHALEGRVWVAGFIFTRCPGPCLKVTRAMVGLHKRLEGKGDFSYVSFSIDPDFDTPEVLTRYATTHGADHPDWWFLTGSAKPIIEMTAKGFLLPVVKQDDPTKAAEEGMYIHSTRLVLVDRKGYIRGYYDSDSPEAMTKLESDAIWLLSQYSEPESAAKLK